ncbi:hypothetical protein LY76DRAFT_152801 [Colletotrichum caudatum]|nr:hypothetical protein LY76DRAFT_152801 [Colletotrichum caudatum]
MPRQDRGRREVPRPGRHVESSRDSSRAEGAGCETQRQALNQKRKGEGGGGGQGGRDRIRCLGGRALCAECWTAMCQPEPQTDRGFGDVAWPDRARPKCSGLLGMRGSLYPYSPPKFLLRVVAAERQGRDRAGTNRVGLVTTERRRHVQLVPSSFVSRALNPRTMLPVHRFPGLLAWVLVLQLDVGVYSGRGTQAISNVPMSALLLVVHALG